MLLDENQLFDITVNLTMIKDPLQLFANVFDPEWCVHLTAFVFSLFDYRYYQLKDFMCFSINCTTYMLGVLNERKGIFLSFSDCLILIHRKLTISCSLYMCLEEGCWVLRIKQPGGIFIYSYTGGRLFLSILSRMDTFLYIFLHLYTYR